MPCDPEQPGRDGALAMVGIAIARQPRLGERLGRQVVCRIAVAARAQVERVDRGSVSLVELAKGRGLGPRGSEEVCVAPHGNAAGLVIAHTQVNRGSALRCYTAGRVLERLEGRVEP